MSASSDFLSRRWVRVLIALVVVAVVLVLPLALPEFANQTLARIGVFAVAVLGLNVVMGYTGQVSLGQIFFVGLGAYITAYGVNNDWNIIVVFLASVLVPAVVGLLIALAAARLGGLAIAMVTIALPIVGVPLAKRLAEFTGGSQGTSARFSDAPEWTGLYDDQWQLYIVILIGGIVFLLTRNLVSGKYGRAFAIVKENEAVASSMGISPYRFKVLAFTIASLIGGVSGFLYMVVVQYTSPETMSFGHSIQLLAAMVIGGAGSIVGSLLGGAYYVLAPQLTNTVDPNLTAVLQGALLLLVLFLLPGGLASLPARLRRLRRRRGGGEHRGRASATSSADVPTPVAPKGTQTERHDQS
ncbi:MULTISPECIES: branched-chain amino acid ABC transporter permease [unclassified Microbacterium]|uniref:branched-chain amino acid ABC transporter permease n=1 Tax=unclassified Microbacterium TaxID=2609290 RepID=UPI00214BC9B0|nr:MULTISPECIES: branched-chain amino acid ABC transporter permease [unclassified Microbacterium]MCR2783242.1 branched-chain amino acid ABC transporter permease [Microbacterium sp. zg.B96]WIM15882.1 branched-chain amino acid ABC transporter permease [Microbacterium sp. zg-B96]